MVAVLDREIRANDLSHRQIRELTGMSLNRISLALRQTGAPITMGEVGLFAAALGMPASALTAQAERLAAEMAPPPPL